MPTEIRFDRNELPESIDGMNSRGINSRLLTALGAVLFLALLTGCRWQVGKLPFPTPTPSPTATPTPSVSVSSSAASSTEEPEAVSLAARVATAAAEYLSESTAEAVDSASIVGSSLSEVDGNTESLAGGVSRARASLAVARDAYRKSEAAVFFVDPDSAEELRAQPDPFGVASPTVENKAIEQLEAALAKLEDLLDGSIDSSNAGALLVEAKSVAAELENLEKGLREMADAWTPQDLANFRAKYFLESPESALARILQGLLAMTGDLLPADVASAEAGANRDTVARVAAVREIYLGAAGDEAAAVSLHALVRQASPVQAALTRASIARAAALASVLEISPENESVRSQLAPALQDVTRQLTSAAETLGIVVVSGE